MSGAVVGGFHRCGNERRARGAEELTKRKNLRKIEP
jgi:hypothetical protein